MDYPYEPRHSYSFFTFFQDLPALRRAILAMPPSVLLVNDYLRTRPDVDTTRMILLGYSFGAPFVPVTVANDHRWAAAAMVQGGGDLRALIAHNVARHEGEFAGMIAGSLGALLLRPLEPLDNVARIAPVPLVMINGTRDEMIPADRAEELFAAAREPKRIVWLDAAHVAMILMLLASTAISNFIHLHPSLKMLALSFLLMIGVTLTAEGMEFHFPKAYLYFAMGFSGFVETLNILAGTRRRRGGQA